MALWLHLHLPCLAVEIMTRGAEETGPVVVIAEENARAAIVSCNPRARAIGLEPGMSLGSAWALTSALTVHHRQPAREAAALSRLADWSMQFTSFVSLEPPDGVSLEIEGSLSLFGGLIPLLGRVSDGLTRLGYTVNHAVAPTPGAAGLLARVRPGCVVADAGALPASLAPLPLSCLVLEARTLARMEDMGLRRVGDCLRLPRTGLGRRVRGVVESIDRALGRSADPRRAYRPPPIFREAIQLPAPVDDVEALLFATNRLLHSLHGFLSAKSCGASAVRLRLGHDADRGQTTEVGLSLVSPVREPSHLVSLLREKLDRITLSVPIERVELEVSDMASLAPQPEDLFATRAQQASESFDRLIERLCARLGEDAVRWLSLEPDHRPERAWSIRTQPAAPAQLETPSPLRPVWLLSPPTELPTNHDKPCFGGDLALSCPERIESGWWDDGDVSREYFLARNPRGELLWVFRDRRQGSWYLHGLFG